MAQPLRDQRNEAANTEHKRNEAYIASLLNLLERAPKQLRGASARESQLPPSALARPADPVQYLDQAEARAREAAEKLPRPLIVRWFPFFAGGRFQQLKDQESERVAGLCRLLGGEERTLKQAVAEGLAGLSLPFTCRTRFEPTGRTSGRVEIDLPGAEVIPSRLSSILKDGRISYKNWPERERNEAYARLVASIALLHAAVALDTAPSIEALAASGLSPAIDPRTGMDTVVCLISVVVDRAGIEKLRLDRLDPVAALSNFPNRFEVGRGAALQPVEALDLSTEPVEVETVEPLERKAARARRNVRAAAASPGATRSGGPAASGAPPPDAEGEIAADALRVAIACARSDGRFEDSELQSIGALIEERFAPTALEKKRLDLLREELKGGAIDVGQAAARLRARLTALERRLLVEGIFSALLAKGAVAESEVRLLETVAQKLDLPLLTLTDIQRRAGPSPPGSAAGAEKWLAALELPADSNLTRDLIERSARRILDAHAEERFAALGPEFQALAQRRREGAEEARRRLLAGLPEERAAAPPPRGSGTAGPRRDNPDLDAVFGG